MTPLERLRIEKAAADCGFEMTPELAGAALRLRSARFPECVDVEPLADMAFRVVVPASLRDSGRSTKGTTVPDLSELYGVLRVKALVVGMLPRRQGPRCGTSPLQS